MQCLDDALNAKSNEPFVTLGTHLTQVKAADAVPHLVDTLLLCTIPSSPFYNALSKQNVELAISVVSDINAILRSFGHISVELQEKYLKALAESWEHMVQWLHFFLTIASSTDSHQHIIMICLDTMVELSEMLADCEPLVQVRPMLEEIVFSNCAIDYVFRLITHSDPANDVPHIYIIGPVGCKLLTIIMEYLRGDDSRAQFTDRLNTIAPKLRRQVLQRLVARAGYFLAISTQDGVAHSAHMVLTGLWSLSHLVQCTAQLLLSPSLRTTLLKCDFAYQYCHSLMGLCLHARQFRRRGDARVEQVWRTLESIAGWMFDGLILCSPLDPVRVVAPAVRGGLLEVGLYVIAYFPSRCEHLENMFFSCLSYFTLREVCVQARARGSLLIEALTEATGNTLCTELREAMATGSKVFFGREAELRKNTMYPCAHCEVSCWQHLRDMALTLSQGFPADKSSHQTCGGCHAVIYCSKKCQEEDWTGFHSEECSKLSSWYTGKSIPFEPCCACSLCSGRKESGFWVSLTTQRDYVLYLQYVANELLPPTSHIHIPTESQILVLDFSTGTQFLRRGDYEGNLRNEQSWREIGGCWAHRIVSMAQTQIQASTGGKHQVHLLLLVLILAICRNRMRQVHSRRGNIPIQVQCDHLRACPASLES